MSSRTAKFIFNLLLGAGIGLATMGAASSDRMALRNPQSQFVTYDFGKLVWDSNRDNARPSAAHSASAPSSTTGAGSNIPFTPTFSGETTAPSPAVLASPASPVPAQPLIDELTGAVEPPRSTDQGRDMYQMPPGICGSFSYNPNGGQVKQSQIYAHPVTGCAFTAMLQEWNQQCQRLQPQAANNDRGCRLAWGHISSNTYKFKSRFWGHSTHTDGYCIDIRPLRSGSFKNAPLQVGQSGYSWNYTQQMIALSRKYGADVVYFNESPSRRQTVGAKYASFHHNHVHICFKPGPKTRQACQDWEPNYNTCPGAQGWVKMLKRRELK